MIYQPKPIFDNLNYFDSSIQLEEQSWYNNLQSTYWQTNFLQDYQQAKAFLKSYDGNHATFNSYRREIERLLHWCWTIAKKELRKINRQDIECFIDFCQQPSQHWIGLKQEPRFVNSEGFRKSNSNWRPFVVSLDKVSLKKGRTANVTQYLLSPKALQAIFSVLSSFFNYLLRENYTSVNPVAQIRQKSKYLRKNQTKTIIRRLSELQWAYVIETVEIMAQENPTQHERTLFMMKALYGMYLRISELVATDRWLPVMGHFYQDHDSNWWFTTVGKGNKQRDISVSHAMLEALKRYRKSFNLPPLPPPGDHTILIPKFRGMGAINSTRQIRKLVQHCFDRSIERLRADGFQDDADQLMAATVHWLRHTGISEDVKIRPREHVRDDAGHSSSAITDKYIDIEKQARAQSAKNKIINPNEQ